VVSFPMALASSQKELVVAAKVYTLCC